MRMRGPHWQCQKQQLRLLQMKPRTNNLCIVTPGSDAAFLDDCLSLYAGQPRPCLQART